MKYNSCPEAWLVFEDGTSYKGLLLVNCTARGEICFNTEATGYQEIILILYFGQIISQLLTTILEAGSSWTTRI